MKRRRYPSFSVQELLVVLFVATALILVGLWVFSKQRNMVTYSDKASVPGAGRIDESKPVLQNLGGVYLAAYNKTTGSAGDLKFDRSLLELSRGIEFATVLFGQKVPQADKTERVSTGFEFKGLVKPVDVVAAIDGKVLFIKHQPDSADYQLVLAKSDASAWLITYNHVADIKAKRGDRVLAGQVLGTAAPYKNGTYWYTLQANRSTAPTGDVIEYVCPSDLLSEEVRPAYVEGLNLFVRDWTTFRTKDVYGTQDGGCISHSLEAKELAD